MTRQKNAAGGQRSNGAGLPSPRTMNGNLRPPEDGDSYTANDAGRAEQFVDTHAELIRYVPAWHRWLVWQEHYWRPDDDGAITRLAVEHSRHLIREAAEIPNKSSVPTR